MSQATFFLLFASNSQVKYMRMLRYFLLVTVAIGLSLSAAATSQAQVSISIGPEPACPYGYYDYSPYTCAPYGYYGPEWFSSGAFVGVGPWFHGRSNFHGKVNNKYDPQHGYNGPTPQRGEKPAASKTPAKFHGNETRDGRGHTNKK